MPHAPNNRGLAPHEELLADLTTTRAPAMRSDVDWDAFVVDAVRHGVAQWIAGGLGDLPIPDQHQAILDRIYRANARRNVVLFDQAARLSSALATNGIDHRILKGAALALTVYRDPAQRNLADIDILVPEADFARAADIARTSGFGGRDPYDGEIDVTFTADADEDILTETMAYELDPAAAPDKLAQAAHLVKVEIHRSLFRHSTGFLKEGDIDPFWKGSLQVTLPDGTTALAFAPEAMLVHLAQHAADHGFSRLLFPLDIARLLATNADLDWPAVVEISRATGQESSVLKMLTLVQAEFGAAVPEDVIRTLSAGSAAHPLTIDAIFRAMNADRGEVVWDELRTSGWRTSVGIMRRMVFPPAEFLDRVHGPSSGLRRAALYAYRPFYLIGRLGQIVARRRAAAAGRR